MRTTTQLLNNGLIIAIILLFAHVGSAQGPGCNPDVTPPALVCPPDATIQLDTGMCDRVYCYPLEVSENCRYIPVNQLPGFFFLGFFNGNSYFISDPYDANSYMDWEEANLKAAEIGGHMAVITSADENQFIEDNIIGFFPTVVPYWIGMRHSPSLGDYKWTTGEDMTYENWAFGVPGILGGDFVFFWDFFNGWWFSNALNPPLPRPMILEVEGGLLTPLVEGIPSGNRFPYGTTTVTYESTDFSGNTASCSFDVYVERNEALACKNVNVSVDERCEALITPEMALAGIYQCYDPFIVELADHHGHPISNPVNADHIGDSIQIKVTDTITGNSCWSWGVVEDKFPPTLVCRDIDLYCVDMRAYRGPITRENCTTDTIIQLSERIDKVDCNAPDADEYIKKVTKTYVAIDAYGNRSDTCTMVIRLLRIQWDEINAPRPVVRLECDGLWRTDGNGNPHPSETGVPTWRGYDLWPNEHGEFCNIYVNYTDNIFPKIGCVEKIMRQWEIREWHCGEEHDTTMIQFIEIHDTKGPVIVCPPNRTVNVDRFECAKTVYLDDPIVSSECGSWFYEVRHKPADPFGNPLNGGTKANVFQDLQTGQYYIKDLPVGLNWVIYKVYDDCYNLNECAIEILVRDDHDPIAICDENTAVSLQHDGFATVKADVFNDGSFDECELDYFEVRRMDDPCGNLDDLVFGPDVTFCCADVGNEVMVAFRAVDKSGNSSVCMVNVDVQDKQAPTVICPPDITIHCSFDFDPDNLDIFGKIVTADSLREAIILDGAQARFAGPALDGVAYV